jgi:scyllo-inositol 2-dehydrogenase (NADP+)
MEEHMKAVARDSIIRVGIAGLGRSGWALHAFVLQRMPERFKVQAVFDLDRARASDAAKQLQCVKVSSYGDLVRSPEVDLIVIALPSNLHHAKAVEAARAGKHVLVEKPFATSVPAARRMLDAARRAGTIVTCNQNLRFAPDFRKVLEIVQSGVLGRIIQIRIAWHSYKRRWDWQTLKRMGGGTLNNDGSHVIDQALVLLGSGEIKVFCAMARSPLCLGDAEDHVKVLLHGRDMPLADIEMTNVCALAQDPWLVLGTKGTLTGSRVKLQWKYIDERALQARQVSREPTPDRSYNREEFTWLDGTYDIPQESYDMSVQRLYVHLCDVLQGRAPLDVTPESLARQIEVLEKCRAAASLRTLESW